MTRSETSGNGTPGPDFWSWTPPEIDNENLDDVGGFEIARKPSPCPVLTNPVIEKPRAKDFLSLPFESKLSEPDHSPPIPPLQSLIEIQKEIVSESTPEAVKEEHEIGSSFSAHAAEVAHALESINEASTQGMNADGSRWWKETGVERRPDGVICRWTMMRGVSADQVVEWQDKYWEASDDFGYKELGSEKTGRDAAGNIWREHWRESMRQVRSTSIIELHKVFG